MKTEWQRRAGSAGTTWHRCPRAQGRLREGTLRRGRREGALCIETAMQGDPWHRVLEDALVDKAEDAGP